MKVLVTKGTHKGKVFTNVECTTEDIGDGYKYALKDNKGNQVWNGDFYWFDKSWIKVL